MKNKFKFSLMTLLFVFVLVLFDQWTKLLAVRHLSDGDIDVIAGVLQLHYLRNTGAAFSLLENKMGLFYIVTPVLCAIIAYLFFALPKVKKFLSLRIVLIFLFAGAVGNFIDRILYQSVVDFIYVSLINFPVFNVADIYVTCSVFVLFILILFVYDEEDLNAVFHAFKRTKK